MRVFSATILVLVLLSSSGSVGAVELHLSGKDAGITGYKGMLMDENEGNNEETIMLAAAEKVLWFSKPMERDVIFSKGCWKLIYWAKTDASSGHRIYVRFYVWDGSLKKLAERYNTLDAKAGLKKKTKEIYLESLQLKKGDRLVVEINWSKSAGKDLLTLYFNSSTHSSRLETPPLSIPSPIPEFPPPVLSIAVVFVLASYGIFRQRIH